MKKFFRTLTVVLSVLCVFVFGFVAFGEITIPENIIISDNSRLSFYGIYKGSVDEGEVYPVFSDDIQEISVDDNTKIKLFGIVPVKNCSVRISNREYVALGGELIGIRIYSDGVLVLSPENVLCGGNTLNPGEIAGIEKGDIIIAVNGDKISTCLELTRAVNESKGNKLQLTLKRNENIFNTQITPLYSADGNYRIGLWVRDSSAGIGTLTFIDTETGVFSALGHAICDTDTSIIMPVGGGDILTAVIRETVKGQVGATGELKGAFGNKVIGSMYYNGNNGIYGKYKDFISDVTLVPIAEVNEIKVGSAKIVSTVENGEKQFYDVEIEKIDYTENDNTHNLTIRVTDKALLEKTGGIVQGMSGSPIIQDGKLIGAVTHVFMNDPERGYGIFARTMLEQAGKFSNSAA